MWAISLVVPDAYYKNNRHRHFILGLNYYTRDSKRVYNSLSYCSRCYYQWCSQAGAHWGTCPSNWRLCPTSAGAPENYRCRMYLCIFRMRSVCSPDLNVYVFAVSTTVTLASYPGSSPVEKWGPGSSPVEKRGPVFLQGRSLGTRLQWLYLRTRRFIAKAWSKCSNSRQRHGLK